MATLPYIVMNIFNAFESVLSNLFNTEFFVICIATVTMLSVFNLVKLVLKW